MITILALLAAVGGLLLFTATIHLTARILSRLFLLLAGIDPDRYRKG